MKLEINLNSDERVNEKLNEPINSNNSEGNDNLLSI